MKKRVFARTALLVLALMVVAASPLSAEQIRLKTGDLLQGKILEGQSTEDRLAFQLFSTGGVFHLKWDQLITEDETRIREMLGYIEVDVSAVPSRPGHLVILITNQKIPGLVLNPSDKTGPVRLKRSDGVREYPRDSVAAVRDVEVEALDIYSPAELADIYMEEISPEAPASWIEYGNLCFQAGAYARAQIAYETALADEEYAASDNAAAIRNRLRRVEILVRAEDAMDKLQNVRRLRFQKRYDQALDQLEQLEEEYAESPAILKELNLERYFRQVLADRRKHFLGVVRRSFFKNFDKLVHDKVRERIRDREGDRDIGIREVQMWVSNPKGLTYGIFTAISEQTGLTEIEARKFWDERTSRQVRHYSYGTGTYLHPEVQQKAQEAAKATAGTRNQRNPRSSRRQPRANRSQQRQKAKSPEEWWKVTKTKYREAFVKAYYADFGQEVLKVLRIKTHPCQECGGTGVKIVNDPASGQQMRLICAVCNKSGHERIVVCR